MKWEDFGEGYNISREVDMNKSKGSKPQKPCKQVVENLKRKMRRITRSGKR